MKKFFASLFILAICIQSSAQEENIRPRSFGVSFILNDFNTASRIRSAGLESVLHNDEWSKLTQMSPGLALSYFKGLHRNIDFAGTIAASFVKYPFPNKPAFESEHLLLEADASANFKLFSDAYWFTPYFSAGIGASRFKSHYGAFVPLGVGFKVNFFDEAALFMNTSYRVPVTAETTNYHFMYSLGIAGVIGKKN